MVDARRTMPMRFRSIAATGALLLAAACSGHGTTALVPQARNQNAAAQSIAQNSAGPTVSLA
jgi:hypothetical protein